MKTSMQPGKHVELTVENRQRSLPVSSDMRNLLLRAAQGCIAAMKFPHPVHVHVELVGNARIRALNRTFRGKDAVTDVLSFPAISFSDGTARLQPGDVDPENGQLFLGDLAICLPRMAEQAAQYGHGEPRELSFLMAHGMLHLLGLDHQTQAQEQEMFSLQELVLAEMGLAREVTR